MLRPKSEFPPNFSSTFWGKAVCAVFQLLFQITQTQRVVFFAGK